MATKSFLKTKKWRDFVRQNTLRNDEGHAVISRDDPWFYDDVWDKDFKELMARGDEKNAANSSARSLVR